MYFSLKRLRHSLVSPVVSLPVQYVTVPFAPSIEPTSIALASFVAPVSPAARAPPPLAAAAAAGRERRHDRRHGGMLLHAVALTSPSPVRFVSWITRGGGRRTSERTARVAQAGAASGPASTAAGASPGSRLPTSSWNGG